MGFCYNVFGSTARQLCPSGNQKERKETKLTKKGKEIKKACIESNCWRSTEELREEPLCKRKCTVQFQLSDVLHEEFSHEHLCLSGFFFELLPMVSVLPADKLLVKLSVWNILYSLSLLWNPTTVCLLQLKKSTKLNGYE